jgi:hypothetical protein
VVHRTSAHAKRSVPSMSVRPSGSSYDSRSTLLGAGVACVYSGVCGAAAVAECLRAVRTE